MNSKSCTALIHTVLLCFLLAVCLCGCTDKKSRPVILISLDTLRQDHLGCYGYSRDTSPNLDRFADEDAILFESAYCQSPYTLPSHMSMLTGLYPETHGVLFPLREDGTTQPVRLARNVITLAEVLKKNGFKTTAFTDGVFLDKEYGFAQGFDEYRDERNPEYEDNGFRKFEKPLHDWIRNHVKDDFFLFIHSYDTHSPYVPPEAYRSLFKDQPLDQPLPEASMQYLNLLGVHAIQKLDRVNSLKELVDLYDGCIAFVDQEVGKLFSLLKKLELWDEALILVTSDHGQSFMESGLMIGHGLCSTNEEILIPFLLKLPGSLKHGTRVSHVVESIDIMPTILRVMDISTPKDCQGQDLVEGINKNLWPKNHAFGLSPCTGNNHYLVQDGIKYIEAVNDPDQGRLRLLLKPLSPPTATRPEAPYFQNEKGALFYDFEKDPLGVIELFYRGDRAYDLQASPFEKNAEEVKDLEVLESYKKAALSLSAFSIDKGLKFRNKSREQVDLSDEHLADLNALGYGGMVDSASIKRDEGASNQKPDPALKIHPPLTDRSLLNRGDALSWKAWQYLKNHKRAPTRGIDLSELEQARACYEFFKSLNPDKESWVAWRLKFIDLAVRAAKEAGK